MEINQKKPDIDRAIELAENLKDELLSYLISTTRSPEDLLTNSCKEQECQDKFDELLELYLIDDANEKQVWDSTSKFITFVGSAVSDLAFKDSKNCILREGLAFIVKDSPYSQPQPLQLIYYELRYSY